MMYRENFSGVESRERVHQNFSLIFNKTEINLILLALTSDSKFSLSFVAKSITYK